MKSAFCLLLDPLPEYFGDVNVRPERPCGCVSDTREEAHLWGTGTCLFVRGGTVPSQGMGWSWDGRALCCCSPPASRLFQGSHEDRLCLPHPRALTPTAEPEHSKAAPSLLLDLNRALGGINVPGSRLKDKEPAGLIGFIRLSLLSDLEWSPLGTSVFSFLFYKMAWTMCPLKPHLSNVSVSWLQENVVCDFVGGGKAGTTQGQKG